MKESPSTRLHPFEYREMDLLWLYVLIVVLVVGAIIAGILCCVLAKEDAEEEARFPKDDD